MRYKLEATEYKPGRLGEIFIVDTDPWPGDERQICIPMNMEAAKLIVEALNKYEESKNV